MTGIETYCTRLEASYQAGWRRHDGREGVRVVPLPRTDRELWAVMFR